MIELQYILLHLIVFTSTFAYCKKIEKQPSRNFWKLATFPIICFSLEEGLRWGRQIDWCFYYSTYSDILNTDIFTYEPLFWVIWSFFAMLGMPYSAVITFCSFLLILSIFYFCRPYKKCLYIVIPLLVVTTGAFAANLIRWYMAVSFMLFGLRLFLDKKLKKSMILFLCSFCCHYAIILGLIMLAFVAMTWKKCICNVRWVVAISLLLILVTAIYHNIMNNLIFIATLFSSVSRFEQYIGNANAWFSIDKEFNFFSLLLSMIPLYIIVYGAYIYRKENRQYHFFYNCFVLALWIKSAGQGLELALRYKAMLDIFIYTVTGMVFISAYKKNIKNVIIRSSIVIYMLLQLFLFCRPLPDNAHNLYVWDSGKKSAYELLGKYKAWW